MSRSLLTAKAPLEAHGESLGRAINSLCGHDGHRKPLFPLGIVPLEVLTQWLTRRRGRHGVWAEGLGTRSERKAQLLGRWCPNAGAFKLLDS